MKESNELSFDPEDARLTAYALGELPDGEERAQVEALLAQSAEARAEVEEIRSLCATLTAEYEQERAENAEQGTTLPLPPPSNVVVVKDWAWNRPVSWRGAGWMMAAAVVLVFAGLAGMLLTPWPTSAVFHVSQSLTQHPSRKVTGRVDRAIQSTPAAALPNSATHPAAPGGNAVATEGNTPSAFSRATVDQGSFIASYPAADKKAESLLSPAQAASPSSSDESLNQERSTSSLLAATRVKPIPFPIPIAESSANRTMPMRNAGDATENEHITQSPGTPEANRAELAGSNLPTSKEIGASPVGFPDQVASNQVNPDSGSAPTTVTPAFGGRIALNKATAVTLDQNRVDARGGVNRRLPRDDASGGAGNGGAESTLIDGSGKSADKRDFETRSPASPHAFSLAAADAPVAAAALAKSAPVPGAPAPARQVDGVVQYGSPISPRPGEPTRGTVVYSDGSSEPLAKAETDLAGRPDFTSKDQIAVFAGPLADASLKRNVIVPTFDTAAYGHIAEAPFLAVKENPLSTFSVDVDTASYAIVRRFIEGGRLPPPDAVRIEELLNYFPYDYAPPAPGDERPFAVHLEGASCPWNPEHRLVRIGLKGREMAADRRPASNLVFLVDVSGSMTPPERLPLVKESLRMLVEKLGGEDRVAIVTYAGHSGLALPSTDGEHKEDILRALGRLEAGGSTNGAAGIRLAYEVAQNSFIKGGTNRVILATDGDFNVGTTSQGELVRLIEQEAKGGVFLTCLGVGTDNLKDATMQKLADHGNGNYAYLDSLAEGRKVLVEQLSGTLVTIAKDVKIQVEFNPATVGAYRLIGYEKRTLRKEDFNDDRVDAGEIGAGHAVTALYEVVPAGQADPTASPAADALKYQPTAETSSKDQVPRAQKAVPGDAGDKAVAPAMVTAAAVPTDVQRNELLTVKIRHKAPGSNTSERSYEVPFVDRGAEAASFANASVDFKFAAAVAEFGLALRDSPYKGNATLGGAVELAEEGRGTDAAGYRAGFIQLARQAEALGHGGAAGR